MNEMLKKLAEASGWTIPEERVAEMAAAYKGTADDTRPVRAFNVTEFLPPTVFKAE